MKQTYISILTAVILLSPACTGWCAGAKIVVVDMGRLLMAHPKTISNRKILEKQADEFGAEQDKLIAEIDRLKNEFTDARSEANNKALSPEGREEMRKIAEDKINDLRKFELKARETAMKRQKEITDLNIRMRKRVVSELREIIRQHARDKKFVLVLDSSSISANGIETVVYNQERIDITDEALALMKQKHPKVSNLEFRD